MRSRTWLPAVVVVAALLTGCGGDDDAGSDVASLRDQNAAEGSTATTAKKTSSTPQDAGRAFARCMRQHGVEMDDPTFSDDGGMSIGFDGGKGGVDPSSSTFRKAQT